MPLIFAVFIVVCVAAWLLRPQRNTAKSSLYSILPVALTSLVLAIAAVAFQILQRSTGNVVVSEISNALFVVGAFVTGAGVLASAIFAFLRRREIAKGLGFGTCCAVAISIIELGLLEWLGGV